MHELSPEEKKKIYEEEKARLEDQEKANEEIKAKKTMRGCGVVLYGCLGIVAVLFFIALIADKSGDKSDGPWDVPTTSVKSSLIKYETLRQWNIPAGGVGMDILVSEDATKEEVLSLAKYFRSTCLPDHFINVMIFDLREAYSHRDDPNYPEEKYFKHCLVEMSRNPKTGYDKINWIGEGRDH